MLRSQTANRTYDNTIILSTIGKLAGCDKNHFKSWITHLLNVDLSVELIQVFCTFRNQRVPAKLHLDKSIRPVPKMNYGIALQPAPVMIVRNPSV